MLASAMCCSASVNAGLVEGTFKGRVTSLNEIGLHKSYQNEYYNGESLFNGDVVIDSEVTGSFSYYSENVAEDISPEVNSLGNYDSQTNSWLSLTLRFGDYVFDIHKPHNDDALPDSYAYQEGIMFNDQGENSGDSFNMQKFYNTETDILEHDAEYSGINSPVGVLNKYAFTQIVAGVLTGNLLTSIDPFQSVSFINDENSYASSSLTMTESYYNLATANYDYYRGASLSMDIDELQFAPAGNVAIPEPSSLYLGLIALLGFGLTRKHLSRNA